MQTKHTPGPWHTFRQGTKHFVSQAADEEFRFAHAVVFETNYHPDNLVAARNEAKANARLIAAAPELHDLVRAARDYLSGIAETAAGGDDEAVTLTRKLSALLARLDGAA